MIIIEDMSPLLNMSSYTILVCNVLWSNVHLELKTYDNPNKDLKSWKVCSWKKTLLDCLGLTLPRLQQNSEMFLCEENQNFCVQSPVTNETEKSYCWN